MTKSHEYTGLNKQKKPLDTVTDRAWVELDVNNLKHNVTVLQNMMQEGCNLMAVVKAEAYGHGAITVSTILNQMGVKSFAVATIDEGIQLRKHGIEGEILVLGYTDLIRVKQLMHYHLIQTVGDHTYAKQLSASSYDLKVHIKVDTGMHRMGISAVEAEKIVEIFGFEHLEICGIYTHLCVSDSTSQADVEFTQGQIATFYELLDMLTQKGVKIPKTHIQSSYGFLNYPELRCSYARIGIALYGTLTTLGDKTKLQPDIRPVLSLKARITCIRLIGVGESVGYGRTFIAKRESRIAVLPVGYADGFPRNLSFGNCEALINGYRVQIYFDSGNQSKKKANDVKTQFLAKKPDVPCYLVYQAPNFKVRVGDFRSRYEAYKLYREIRNDFPSAYIVKDEISFPKN